MFYFSYLYYPDYYKDNTLYKALWSIKPQSIFFDHPKTIKHLTIKHFASRKLYRFGKLFLPPQSIFTRYKGRDNENGAALLSTPRCLLGLACITKRISPPRVISS